MRLNSLHLTNFRQHADTRIEFDLGLTGIIGPNGAGKSTVLEAIAWALYGQSAVRGTRDSIRNVRAGARAPVRVDLDFELSGHRYRVVRGLSSAELYLDGGSEPIATTITDVSDLLARRLGMTRSEFFHTYFTGQKELSVMAAMTPTERAQFLSRVLGYDRIRAAQGLARDRRRMLGAQLTGVKELMPDPQHVESMLKESAARSREAEKRRKAAAKAHKLAAAALAVITPQWEATQRARDALRQIVSDIRLAEQAAEALEKELERLSREIEGVAEAKTQLDAVVAQMAPLVDMQAEFNVLDGLQREEGRRKALTESLRVLANELASIRTRQAALKPVAEQVDELHSRLKARQAALDEATASLDARRTEWERDRTEVKTRLEQLRTQYKDVKAHLEQVVGLGEHGVCPTCDRVLGDHYRTVHESLDEQLDEITVNGRYFTTRLEQLEGLEAELKELEVHRKALNRDVQDIDRQLNKSQAAALELLQLGSELSAKEQRHDQLSNELRGIPSGFDERRHAELERELQRLAPLNEQATRLTARVDGEAALGAEHERVARQVLEARDRVAGLKAKSQAQQLPEEEFQRRRKEFDEAQAALQRAELELQAATMDEARAADAVATAERERVKLEEAREKHARLEAERRVHDELDRAYTDLRTDLNFQLRPELSDLASQFLNQLTDGRYTELELDDQYSLVILEDGIPKPVISGGEEDLSNLVLRLAISQMIAERSGQNFSLLVLDEVFGSLDVARRQNVVDLLRRVQDRFEQVILITHIEGVKDELDHVVLIDYDDRAGTSRVRQLEPGTLELDVADLVPDAVSPVDEMPAGAEL